MNKFPKKRGEYPGTNFANACGDAYYIDPTTNQPSALLSSCPGVGDAITACQQSGKKVLLSLGGGWPVDYYLPTPDVANWFAEFLIGAFGPVTPEWKAANKPRPFGDAAVDGFDLDLEAAHYEMPSPEYLYKNYDVFGKYVKSHSNMLLSGAPQCIVPDARIFEALKEVPFDFLFTQFYNTWICSAAKAAQDIKSNSPSTFTFNTWVTWLKANSKNPNIKLYLGLAAGPDGLPTFKDQYLAPEDANLLIETLKDNSMFGGVMLWEASVSTRNPTYGKSYGEWMKYAVEGTFKENFHPIVSSSTIVSSTITPSSTPVSSTPISSTPISSTPISSTPVSSTPVSSSMATSSTPSPSDYPSSSTPASSTPVSSSPISSTLVSSTPLSSTLVSSTPLSSTPVSSSMETISTPSPSDYPASSTPVSSISVSSSMATSSTPSLSSYPASSPAPSSLSSMSASHIESSSIPTSSPSGTASSSVSVTLSTGSLSSMTSSTPSVSPSESIKSSSSISFNSEFSTSCSTSTNAYYTGVSSSSGVYPTATPDATYSASSISSVAYSAPYSAVYPSSVSSIKSSALPTETYPADYPAASSIGYSIVSSVTKKPEQSAYPTVPAGSTTSVVTSKSMMIFLVSKQHMLTNLPKLPMSISAPPVSPRASPPSPRPTSQPSAPSAHSPLALPMFPRDGLLAYTLLAPPL